MGLATSSSGATRSSGIPWTPPNLLYLLLAVLSGGAIFIALNLITATSAFWLMDSIPVTQIVFNTHEFAKYPLNIYPRAIGWLAEGRALYRDGHAWLDGRRLDAPVAVYEDESPARRR